MSASHRTAIVPRLVVCLLAVAAAAGCASKRQAASETSMSEFLAKVRQKSNATPKSPSATSSTLEHNDPELAAARLVLASAPTAEHHRRVAEAYLRLGVRDAAYDHFTDALRLDRTDASSYDGRARIWRDWGFPQLGLADAHKAIFHAPRSAVAQNTLGTLLLKLGRSASALAAFQRAMSLDPSAAYAASNLCYLHLTNAQTAQAIKMCSAAVEIQPDLKAARNNLALAYAAAGDFARAEKEFAGVADSATAAYNMGIAYMTTGRLEEAAEEFQAAWSANPKLALAAQRLRQIEARRSK